MWQNLCLWGYFSSWLSILVLKSWCFFMLQRVWGLKKWGCLHHCIPERRFFSERDLLCADWPSRVNPAISLHVCYWLQKKEYLLSSSHHCIEGSKFFTKFSHWSIVLSHSCLTGGTRWDHMLQIFPACAVLPELTNVCHFCSYTVDRKLTPARDIVESALGANLLTDNYQLKTVAAIC